MLRGVLGWLTGGSVRLARVGCGNHLLRLARLGSSVSAALDAPGALIGRARFCFPAPSVPRKLLAELRWRLPLGFRRLPAAEGLGDGTPWPGDCNGRRRWDRTRRCPRNLRRWRWRREGGRILRCPTRCGARG